MNYYDKYGKITADSIMKRGEEVFNNFFNVLEHPDFPFVTLTSTTNGMRQFPPYDIIESTDGKVRLEMAVAGYTKDRITVEKEGNTLIIQGKATKPITADAMRTVPQDIIRHKGISNAAFMRTFDMNMNTEVADVQLKDGILTVYVTSTKPAMPPRTTFEIK